MLLRGKPLSIYCKLYGFSKERKAQCNPIHVCKCRNHGPDLMNNNLFVIILNILIEFRSTVLIRLVNKCLMSIVLRLPPETICLLVVFFLNTQANSSCAAEFTKK